MHFATALALAAVAELAAAAATSRPYQLANGNWFQAGSISSSVMWQASGTLTYGRCPFSIAITDCYTSVLGANGNLQSTTQADYLAALASTTTTAPATTTTTPTVFYPASASGKTFAASNSRTFAAGTPLTAEEEAILNDEDLDAYFAAFPEQEPSRYSSALMARSDGSFKAKRQVVGCGTGGGTTTPGTPTTTTSAGGSTPTVSLRQRNEIFTWPGTKAASTWTYRWKTYQSRTTSTNYQFFHAWQILRRDGCGGYSVALDYVNGQVRILDAVRGCTSCVTFKRSLSYWFGQVITHEMTITYGINGSLDYKAYVGVNLRVPGLTYSATGDMGSSASLKFGQYRRWQPDMQTEAVNYSGDLVATCISGC
ncbi:hypothetical protein JCM8097_009339 [Rhodosporidiobolus ruineniae]